MNPLGKILLVAIALGAPGMARADQTTGTARASRTAEPHSALVDSNLYSFADIANLPAGAEHRLLTGNAFPPAREMTLSELAAAAQALPERSAAVHVAGSPAGSVLTLNSTGNDLPVGAGTKDFSASGHSAAHLPAGANFLFSTTEIPEPGNWMTVVCGLVVVGFMARRKR